MTEPLSAPGIHDWPPGTATPEAPFDQKQMRAFGQAWTYKFLAQVLYAISGIELFGIPGFTPFAGLKAWADELNERANEALGLGLYANAILAAQLETNVSGGVEINDLFNGPVAEAFDESTWELLPSGGAGIFAPNGQGKAVWTISGGLTAIRNYRHVTETVGDDQAIQFLLTELPGTPNSAVPYIYVRGRINAAQDSEVYLRLSRTGIRIGCFSGGSEYLIDSLSMTLKTGVWTLQCGTDDGVLPKPREFVVYHNNIEKRRAEDVLALSDVGAAYRGVGLAAEAASRNFATSQTTPGQIDAWAAADRTAT